MILVSACLAGFPCRYDGEAKEQTSMVELVRRGEAIPVCPEQMGGFGTPRSPAELTQDGAHVFNAEGQDVTSAFQKGALVTLSICKRYAIKRAYLTARSPSCGCGCVHDGSFSGRLRTGDGVTAALLKQNGIEVISVD